MTDIKFLRRFNLVVFSILLVIGITTFYFLTDRWAMYVELAGVVSTVLVPLVVFAAAGSPVKKLIENQTKKIEVQNGGDK